MITRVAQEARLSGEHPRRVDVSFKNTVPSTGSLRSAAAELGLPQGKQAFRAKRWEGREKGWLQVLLPDVQVFHQRSRRRPGRGGEMLAARRSHARGRSERSQPSLHRAACGGV